MPAFQPDWRKSTVRNDRGDDGNVSIIRSLVRAIVLPGNRTHVRNLGSCRHLDSETIPKRQNQGGRFGALQAPATIRMRFLEACAFFARRLVCQVCQPKDCNITGEIGGFLRKPYSLRAALRVLPT